MIINRILKMPLLKMPLLRTGDKLMERNGKLVTIDLDIGDVQPGHLRLRLTPGTVLPSYFSDLGTFTHLCTDPNIWDLNVRHGHDSTWDDLLVNYKWIRDEIIGVVDGDCTDVRTVYGLFANCPNIRSVGPLYNTGSLTDCMGMFYCENGSGSIDHVTPFDTSNVQRFTSMFQGQAKLKEVPLLDTTWAQNLNLMYDGCVSVKRGTVAAYNEMTSHGDRPWVAHHFTFHDCGLNTESGRAELAQIPDDWKS